jgi:hypothetical protein
LVNEPPANATTKGFVTTAASSIKQNVYQKKKALRILVVYAATRAAPGSQPQESVKNVDSCTGVRCPATRRPEAGNSRFYLLKQRLGRIKNTEWRCKIFRHFFGWFCVEFPVRHGNIGLSFCLSMIFEKISSC